MRNALLAAASAAAAVLVTAPAARANGRFPASNAIYFSPSDPNLVVMRATFGMLPSHDGGQTWHWLCEDTLGLGPTTNEDPNLALTNNNSLVAGLSLGMYVSPDTGCTWGQIGGSLAGQLVKDLAVRPNAPDTVLAITSTYEPDAGVDGGAGYTQHVLQSVDDGAHWTQLGTIDPNAIVTTLDVAASDPQRIYVSAFRGEGATRTASLFESTDGGATWTEHAVPFDANTEAAVYIAAVDPTNADRVYVRSEGASRLTVTSDGGKTFTVALSLQDQMLGFALSPDGSKVYAGGANVGLYVAASASLSGADAAAAFQPVPMKLPDGGTRTLHVQCLAARSNELWACSDEVSGFIIGVSTDDGATFTPRLHLTTIAGPQSCPASTTSQMCTATNYEASTPYDPFGSLCSNLGVCFDGGAQYPLSEACVDAGVCSFAGGSGSGSGSGGSGSGGGSGGSGGGSSGAGADAGGGAGSPSRSSCGCSMVGGGGVAGALGVAALVAAAARRRRRR